MDEEQQEKKNKKIAFLSTAAIQGLLLLLMFLVVAWRAPYPPMPEYGVELNFGLDTEGFGDIQPDKPVGNAKAQADEPVAQPKPEEEQPEESAEQTVQPEERPTETRPLEEQVESSEESPVIVKEKKEEVKPAVEAPKEKAEEKKVETKPKEDPKAVYKPGKVTAESDDKQGDKAGEPGNHGDDKGKVGDKGNPEGTLDAKALYGKPGGGAGGISMSGFNGFDWPKVQAPTLPDEAFGVYEFMVKVDSEGDVISVTSLKRGLSLEAERKLKEVIQQLVFVPKGSNLPAQSEGKITFRVVSK